MITRPQPCLEPENGVTASWQRDLADAISDPFELLDLLGLTAEELDPAPRVDPAFRLRVPRYYAALMRRGDPRDPLLAQVLSTVAEAVAAAGFSPDPVGDLAALRGPGVLQKYRGRALLTVTAACAVHCRYCFRRHFPYPAATAARDITAVGAALQALEGVHEVILSGGDPLTLADERLAEVLQRIALVPGVRRLRIHTRVPVVLPQRVTGRLASAVAACGLPLVWVIHANHPREVTPQLAAAMQRLAGERVTLLNQSVLLKSVNDDADTLETLSEALFDIGVLPYYLHLLDPVAGAAHFDVPQAHAIEVHRALQARLPGYLVPKLVREVAGAAAKTPVCTG